MFPPLHTGRRPPRSRAAFTLIELLLVLAIIGVIVAVALPQFNVGMSGVRVRAAALGYMQSARYARTMALLYQVETAVICQPGGVIRVEAGPLRTEGHGPYVAPDEETAGGVAGAFPASKRPPTNTASRLLSLPAAGTSAFDQSGVGALAKTYTPADVSADELASEGDVTEAIRAEQTFTGVHVQFLGYTDEEPASAIRAELEATESFRVGFRSNGTCRPYRVKVADDAGTVLVLAVDMLGSAMVEGEEAE